ncbi:MAG: polyhydroxyalkanoic acid system family protein [Bdellovibrionia bacterium]
MPSYSRRVQVPGKNSKELFDAVSGGIDRFIEKASIGKFDIEKDAEKKEVRLKGSMFKGAITCSEADIVVSGQLSLLATPFKSKLDEGITRWLAKTFNLTDVA